MYMKNTRIPIFPDRHSNFSFLVPLSICLSGIVSILDDQILWSVIVSSGEVRFKDILRTHRITCLGINGCTRHVWYHRITTIHGVLGIAERMVCGSWLWEPDVAPVAPEMA